MNGNETLKIDNTHGSAIAIDPETGNVWTLLGEGQIGKGKTVVYDPKGNEVATYNITGWDIVYDKKAKAFWIADRKLTKINAKKGEIAFTTDISAWCASSLDADSNAGAVWVAVRRHPQVNGSENRLLKFDENGKKLQSIDLGQKNPFRVSVDQRNGCVWVVNMRKSVERFSPDGKLQAELKVNALAVQVDPAGGDIWVATPFDIQRISPTGNVVRHTPHVGKTTQAWIAALE